MDIKNPNLLKIKGVLFLVLGSIAAGLLLYKSLDVTTAILLSIVIWAFCRFYYFAFYVLHHYADKDYNYAGILHLIRYLLGKR